MMKRINELLPKAMDALKHSGLLLDNETSILKEYDGYVASFAPSVITAGLKATLSFYTDNHKDKSPKRSDILKVLHTTYQSKSGHLSGNDLLAIALDINDNDERQLKKDLIDCSVALKLVMRNFKQIDSKPNSEPQNPVQP